MGYGGSAVLAVYRGGRRGGVQVCRGGGQGEI